MANHQQQIDWQRQRLIHPGEKLQRTQARLELQWQTLKRLQRQVVGEYSQDLIQVNSQLQHHSPQQRIDQLKQGQLQLLKQLQQQIADAINHRKQQLGSTAAALTVLSPLATLARGYAIVRHDENLEVISSGEQLKPQDPIQVQLSDAEIHCRVETISPLKQA